MADDGGGGGGDGGGEGRGGSSQRLPMDNLVEAILSNSQALAEALAAERARLEAQRESCEAEQRSVEELQAAVREKDAEIDRLRAEAADATKKLQADASRKMRWEAAHELLLGANQKLAELRDADMEDSTAETPNSKKTESCKKLNQDTVGHIASDLSAELRKLKQAYETLSSEKDKEVSALLSEKDSVSNQLSILQKEYANKKAEAAQATEAALKLQKSVDELKVLVQKKDDEIGRLQAEAVGAKTNLQKMHSVVKENYDKTLGLQAHIPDDVLRHTKDSNETLKKSRSDDPAVCGKSQNNVGKDGQDEASLKRRRVSSTSNCPQGVPRPYQQLPSASPSASASAAADLIKLKEPEQQPKQEQRLQRCHAWGRGRGHGRSLLRCPVVQRQSCGNAELGGLFLFEVEEEKQQPEEQPHQRGLAHQRQRQPA